MVFLINWNIAFESKAIFKISIVSECYLETLLIGTNPIIKGIKFYFIIVLLDDLVKKSIKFVRRNIGFVFGILKTSIGDF